LYAELELLTRFGNYQVVGVLFFGKGEGDALFSMLHTILAQYMWLCVSEVELFKSTTN